MKLREVGSKVLVKKGTKNDVPFGYNDEMKYYEGMEATIVSAKEHKHFSFGWVGKYKIDIDGELWTWTDVMFEDIVLKKEAEVEVLNAFVGTQFFIERVIYSEPATIVFYKTPDYDLRTGTLKGMSKTRKMVAKCCPTDIFDKEKGLEVAILKIIRREAERKLKLI